MLMVILWWWMEMVAVVLMHTALNFHSIAIKEFLSYLSFMCDMLI